jgi:1-acyl-sn-glycerol-3-phosphate acyltransferase
MEQWQYKPARDLGLGSSERLTSLKRESGLVGLVTRNVWWWMVRGYFRIFQRVRIEGLENLPKDPPFMLVANHCSHFDALLLASALPLKLRNKVFPIAAGDTFFQTPFVRIFAAGAMNALPLWRKNTGKHAMDDLRARLVSEPCGYILFPEGTRSRNGVMKPFKAGVGMLIAGTDIPVVPCNLEGTHRALPPDRRFPRRAVITLRIGRAMTFHDVANTREGWSEIAQRLEAAVRQLAMEEPNHQDTKAPGSQASNS